MVKIETFKNMLMLIGAITILMLVGLAFVVFVDGVKRFIKKKKLKYIQKHRFDKLPTAKCYCIDCKKWDNETGRCYRFPDWYTADNWFCWDADPKK